MHKLLLKHNDKIVQIVFDNDGNPWFNGTQLANLLNYNNKRQAIRMIDKKYRKQLKKLQKNYKKLYKNAQGHSIYISEPGLYKLSLSSKKKSALEIQKWIIDDVLPTLRKTGKYTIAEKYKKQLQDLKQEYKKIESRNKELLNNQKKTKYPEGGMIYVMKPKMNSNKFKVGKTRNMNKRKDTYNTTVPDNVNIVATINVKDPDGIELCVKGLLHNYRYRNNKEYYECTLKDIVDVIELCVNIKDNKVYCAKCGKSVKKLGLKKHYLSRHVKEDTEEVYQIMGIVNKNRQGGGWKIPNYYKKYMKAKIKFLEMKCELMSQ